MATKKKDIKVTGNDIPNSFLTEDTADSAQNLKDAAAAQSPEVAASIGLIKCDVGFDYVGVAPARDKDAKTPGGLKITAENSTFTPLDIVPFSNSIRVKDPKSGEFYFPACKNWSDCELNGLKLY